MDYFENQNTAAAPITTEMMPAGNYARWASNLLDGIYVGLLSIVVFIIFELIYYRALSIDRKTIDMLENNTYLQLTLMIGYFVYHVWFNVKKGATPGKSGYGLKIVKFGSGEYMSYGRAIIREFLKLLSYVPVYGTIYFIINALIILFTKQKRTIYDLIVGTQVVKIK